MSAAAFGLASGRQKGLLPEVPTGLDSRRGFRRQLPIFGTLITLSALSPGAGSGPANSPVRRPRSSMYARFSAITAVAVRIARSCAFASDSVRRIYLAAMLSAAASLEMPNSRAMLRTHLALEVYMNGCSSRCCGSFTMGVGAEASCFAPSQTPLRGCTSFERPARAHTKDNGMVVCRPVLRL